MNWIKNYQIVSGLVKTYLYIIFKKSSKFFISMLATTKMFLYNTFNEINLCMLYMHCPYYSSHKLSQLSNYQHISVSAVINIDSK